MAEDDERFATVSSSVMLKLPTSNLPRLRTVFESEEKGLNIEQYLCALVYNMTIHNKHELTLCVANLLDFFDFVDINGDGFMEWDEFVTFIIEDCGAEVAKIPKEKLKHIGQVLVQDTGNLHPITCSKYLPVFGKILEGVGQEVQFHEADATSETFSTCTFKMPLLDRERAVNNLEATPIVVLDIIYWAHRDRLVVLRSDFCVELCQFMSKTQMTIDTICDRICIPFKESFTKIAIREKSADYNSRIFAIGSLDTIFSWEFSEGLGSQLDLINEVQLKRHKDYVRDILVVRNDLHSLLISCSLDRKVHLWDLETLTYRASKTGNTAGVQCLAFDGKSILFGGGFDYKIIAWDLDNVLDIPVMQFHGHTSPLIKVVPMRNPDRLFSLDERGVLKMWESSIYSPIDKEERHIDEVSVLEDHLRTVELFTKLGSAFDMMHGLLVFAAGKRQQVYKVLDMSPKLTVPISALFTSSLLMIISVHSHEVIFRHAVSGDVLSSHSNMTESGEAISAVLDTRGKKLLLGDSRGIVTIFNCLSGAVLNRIQASSVPICQLIYTGDKTIIGLNSQGDLIVLDDNPRDSSSNLVLRVIEKAHDAEVVCMAYSEALGIIVTADCIGTLSIWDYEFFRLLVTINNCTGAEISQIMFLDPFPILLIKDNMFGFVAIPINVHEVKEITTIWKIEVNPVVLPLHSSSFNHGDQDESSSGGRRIGQANLYTKRQLGRFCKQPKNAKCAVYFIEDVQKVITKPGLVDSGEVTEGVEPAPVETIVVNAKKLSVFCGFEDGLLAVYDLSQFLEDSGVESLPQAMMVTNRPGYDPRRICKRSMSPLEVEKSIMSTEALEKMIRFAGCEIENVWDAHRGPMVSLQLGGHSADLVSCSEDHCIFLWSRQGVLKGVLTYGQDVDKLIRPKWNSLIDMNMRDSARHAIADQYIEKLRLRPTDPKIIDGDKRLQNLHQEGKGKETLKAKLAILGSMVDTDEEPDRLRVVGQLRGRITYDQSDKDVALGTKKEKEQKALEKIKNIGVSKKKKTKFSSLKGDDALYYESCSMNTDFVKQEMSTEKAPTQTSFEFELAQVEAADPNNWEINSKNRQRAMYGHLYEEYDKGGQSGYDVLAILESKADACSPGGNFPQYYKDIIEDNRKVRRERRHQQMLAEEVKRINLNNTVNVTSDDSDTTQHHVAAERKLSPKDELPWELTLRQSISAPVQSSVSPKRSVSPKGVSQEAPKALSETSSPVKRAPHPKMIVSPVDLLRRTRQKALNQFECQVTATEGLFKEAEKSKRALKRAIRKAKKSSNLVSIPKAYSFAELRLSSELSVEDILKFNEKHQISEQNWLRKIAHLTGAEEEDSKRHSHVRKMAAKSLFSAAAKTKLQKNMEEQQLLHRPMFGMYQAAEIMNLFQIFEDLPKRPLLENDEDDISTAQGNDDDNSSWAGSVASSEESSISRVMVSSVGEAERTKDAASLAGSTKSSLKSKQRVLKVTEEEVLVIELLKLRFVHLRPHFYEGLEDYCMKRQLVGEKKQKIYISMKDAVIYMCPLLTMNERQDVIRFLNLHVRHNLKEHKSNKGDRLSEDELVNMRALFEFIDRDQSGKINKEELYAALHLEERAHDKEELEKLSGNTSNEVIAAEGMGSGLEFVISKILAGHNADEITFEEFVELFKDVL